MATVGPNSYIVKEIIDALGLSFVRKLDIRMRMDEAISITVEYLPEGEDMKKLVPILKHYELVEK